jgi:hypothetical protein
MFQCLLDLLNFKIDHQNRLSISMPKEPNEVEGQIQSCSFEGKQATQVFQVGPPPSMTF